MNTLAMPGRLADWLAHCERAHQSSAWRPLEKLRALRDRLGIRFRAPVILVAGTNGKGSTCAMLESIAWRAKLRVGLYSKPHLHQFEERCRIDGAMVDAASLVAHFEAVEEARDGQALSWFEHTTLAILRLLSRSELDLVILEVGLGGRLDVVNVIDADCAVITSVDLDHTETLGPDRESIGREKAGIFRSGRVAVVGDPDPPMSVLAHAQSIGTTLYLAGRDFAAGPVDEGTWHWTSWRARRNALAPPALVGHGQIQNASTALAAFDALGLRIPDETVSRGLQRVGLPGRFQIVPGAPEIVFDVAHNPQAVRALVSALRARPAGGATHLVFGCMADKDIPGLISAFGDLPRQWHTCDLPGDRAATAVELARQIVEQTGATCSAHPTATAALAAARAIAAPADRIVVFGSFLTVAEASPRPA